MMSDTAVIIGNRLRSYRQHLGLSQEKVAELAGFHPTYIGQIERGEKNATIESILKISSVLNVSLSQLFDKVDADLVNNTDIVHSTEIPLKCYDFLLTKSISKQKLLYRIIMDTDKYTEMNH